MVYCSHLKRAIQLKIYFGTEKWWVAEPSPTDLFLIEKSHFRLTELWAESAFLPLTLKPADQPPRTAETGRTTSLSGFDGGFTIFLCLF